jgi:hypothetical protein
MRRGVELRSPVVPPPPRHTAPLAVLFTLPLEVLGSFNVLIGVVGVQEHCVGASLPSFRDVLSKEPGSLVD